MFLIRQARPGDLDDLHSLAKQTYFINLPPEREIIASKIDQSLASFRALASGKATRPTRRSQASSGAAGIQALTGESDLFLFVLEDTESSGVIGTSQIIARMGGPDHPRVSLLLGQSSRRSESLKLEWKHQVATLATDQRGPTEIGGLILNHAFRGHRQRLGRLLSFVRFHFIGLNRRRFADQIIAEMLGAIDHNGYSPFFEKFTRHFIPRAFSEVYRFSQTSKEFVTGLMPEYPLDLTIMDPEVANAAGAVSAATLPARRMLERLGFVYEGHIDPLDGGPHLEVRTDEVTLVRATRSLASLDVAPAAELRKAVEVIVSTLDQTGDFRAIQTRALVRGSRARLKRADQVRLHEDWVSAGATVLDR
ncbi:MAG: arginine N-succinyltransferase [Phycisphaeraceae bacterium]|nr:arginine N-succinyltransferase [Phycisphaeraceae bacterium]